MAGARRMWGGVLWLGGEAGLDLDLGLGLMYGWKGWAAPT